uniref:Uncharacterized protein n=1 Tax=Rhizophora mucronata TaxID=61149 RepID=A0A2P2PL36_RHIMU
MVKKFQLYLSHKYDIGSPPD